MVFLPFGPSAIFLRVSASKVPNRVSRQRCLPFRPVFQSLRILSLSQQSYYARNVLRQGPDGCLWSDSPALTGVPVTPWYGATTARRLSSNSRAHAAGVRRCKRCLTAQGKYNAERLCYLPVGRTGRESCPRGLQVEAVDSANRLLGVPEFWMILQSSSAHPVRTILRTVMIRYFRSSWASPRRPCRT